MMHTFKTNKNTLLPLAALLALTAACGTTAPSDPATGASCPGDAVVVDGATLCVISSAIQETGFMCPPSAPHLSRFGQYRVCSPTQELPQGLPDRMFEDYPVDRLPDPCAQATCAPSFCNAAGGCGQAVCTPAAGGESCGNGADDDCDGQIDCADADCASDAACQPACADDQAEDDDTAATATALVSTTPLGISYPRVACPGDEDWFTIAADPSVSPDSIAYRLLVQDNGAPLTATFWRVGGGATQQIQPDSAPGGATTAYFLPADPNVSYQISLTSADGNRHEYETRLGVDVCDCANTSGNPACLATPCAPCQADALEPNDAHDAATDLPLSNLAMPLYVSLCQDDVDWFKIHDGLPTGATINVRVIHDRGAAPATVRLIAHDPGGNQVAFRTIMPTVVPATAAGDPERLLYTHTETVGGQLTGPFYLELSAGSAAEIREAQLDISTSAP